MKLRDSIKQSILFDWLRAASNGNLQKLQLYRWFYDTYMRHFYEQIDTKDNNLIKEKVANAMRVGVKLDNNFKRNVQNMLSR